MGNNIDRLFQKWDEFQQTHTRIYSPELRSLVFSLYDRLQLELEGEAVFTLKDDDHHDLCRIFFVRLSISYTTTTDPGSRYL